MLKRWQGDFVGNMTRRKLVIPGAAGIQEKITQIEDEERQRQEYLRQATEEYRRKIASEMFGGREGGLGARITIDTEAKQVVLRNPVKQTGKLPPEDLESDYRLQINILHRQAPIVCCISFSKINPINTGFINSHSRV